MAHNYLRQDQLFHRVLHLPVAVAAVSDAVQSILAQQFGRSSLLIPNGVDCDRFFPGPPTDVAPTAILSSPTKAQVGWILTDSVAPIKVVTLNSNHYGMRCNKLLPGLSSTLLMSSQDYRSRLNFLPRLSCYLSALQSWEQAVSLSAGAEGAQAGRQEIGAAGGQPCAAAEGL